MFWPSAYSMEHLAEDVTRAGDHSLHILWDHRLHVFSVGADGG